MTDETTYKVETSGSGSAFQVIVRAYAPGVGRFDGKAVDKRDGFSSRAEAAKWGRAKVRELRGLPPTGKPNGCRNCHWADKSDGSERRRGPWRCAWPAPDLALPDAVTGSTSYHPIGQSRRSVWAGDGETCPTWTAERPKG